METKTILEKFNELPLELEKLKVKNKSLDLFDKYGDLLPKKIYYSYFELVPSQKSLSDINIMPVIEWIESNFSKLDIVKYVDEYYDNSKKIMRVERIIYILRKKIMIIVDHYNMAYVYFPHKVDDFAQSIINSFKKFRRREKKNHVHILIRNSEGKLDLEPLKNKNPKLSLEDNYNDDLPEVHKIITTNLKKKKNSGLILLHGTPGTGKSTYLRHLVHFLKKKVIFISPTIAGHLDSPEIIPLLLQNQESIIIIEDAESLLVSREGESKSNISTILNLTDGILGQSLGIQIICTFNTHVSNLDKALLRKGRLIAMYNFDALSVRKSKKLLEKKGVTNYDIAKPLTLADIYNIKDEQFEYESKSSKPIGFAVKVA